MPLSFTASRGCFMYSITMHRCMWDKAAAKARTVRQRVTVRKSQCYIQLVYLCLFSFMAACHLCFPDLSVGE